MADEDAEKTEKSKKSSKNDKDLKEVAQAVLNGDWGKGQEKRRRLSEAGYNAHEVQAEVVRIINKLDEK